jgi:hypothetical protein
MASGHINHRQALKSRPGDVKIDPMRGHETFCAKRINRRANAALHTTALQAQ